MSDHFQEPQKPLTEAELQSLSPLGQCLAKNAQNKCLWAKVFFAVLALLAVLNIFVPNHHPHFGLDAYWGFWPVFGFVVGVLMIFFVKKVVQPIIARSEDYYGDI